MVVPCAMGRAGLIAAAAKREGDGATPIGRWALTRVFFRPDRMARPATSALPVRALDPDDRWCDDPKHPDYNRLVRAPFEASCETLWREDGLYDLIVETDHNSNPPVAAAGSAIFLHCRNPSGAPTAGCIAVDTRVLARFLDGLRGPAVLDVRRTL